MKTKKIGDLPKDTCLSSDNVQSFLGILTHLCSETFDEYVYD